MNPRNVIPLLTGAVVLAAFLSWQAGGCWTDRRTIREMRAVSSDAGRTGALHLREGEETNPGAFTISDGTPFQPIYVHDGILTIDSKGSVEIRCERLLPDLRRGCTPGAMVQVARFDEWDQTKH